MLHHDDAFIDAAGLVALLDLIERPALAITRVGRVLGSNRRFHELLEDSGFIAAATLEAFLTGDSAERLRTACSGVPVAGLSESFALRFLDGSSHDAKVEVVPSKEGPETLLLVLDAPYGQGPAHRAGASLRHDIAGPLTAILGTAELLLIRGQDLPREVRDSIGQILENCGRITEILAKDRVSSGREPLDS